MIYRGTIFLELISISDDTYEMIAVEDVSLRGVVALNNLFDLCGNKTNYQQTNQQSQMRGREDEAICNDENVPVINVYFCEDYMVCPGHC